MTRIVCDLPAHWHRYDVRHVDRDGRETVYLLSSIGASGSHAEMTLDEARAHVASIHDRVRVFTSDNRTIALPARELEVLSHYAPQDRRRV